MQESPDLTPSPPSPAAVMDALPDAVLVVDGRWRVTYANAAARTRFAGRECGGTLWQWVPDAADPGRARLYDRAMAAVIGDSTDCRETRFEQPVRGAGAAAAETWYTVRCRPVGGGLAVTFTDVTDVKRADQGVADREQRYRLTFERSPQPIFAYDAQTLQFVLANDAAVAKYGYPRDRWRRMTMLDVLPEDERPAVRDYLSRNAHLPSRTAMSRHQRADGTAFPVEVTSHAAVIAGRPVRVVLAVDVTERVRVEQHLNDAHERLRLVTDAANDGIWEWDLTHQTMFWSDRMYEIMRLDPRTFRPTYGYTADHADPGDVARWRAAMSAHVDGGAPYDLEIRLRRGDGTWGQFRIRGKAALSPSGRPTRVAGSLTDVTDRKRAEAELRASEALYRTLGEAMPSLMWSAAFDGHFDYANARFFETLGMDLPDLVARGWPAFVHPDDLPQLLTRWQQDRDAAAAGEMQVRFRVKGGEHRWFLVRLVPLTGHGGEVVRWIGVATDVDELKRAQAELRHAKDVAEHANAAKDQFLAVLSHELRTPLTPVLLTASSMRDEPGLDPDLREALAMIAEQIELEARLIDDLLDLTRISRGKFLLNPVPLDGHEVLRRSVEVCRSTIDAAGVTFAVDYAATRTAVHADPGRMQQVLSNLLSNAAKFTPIRGRVTVRTFDEPRPGGGASFAVEVTDTGVGIEPDVLPRIFNAFEQGERSITRRFGGLGLGLTIGKAIAEMHGGTLTAASGGKDRGATMTLRLPVRVAAAAAVVERVAPPDETRPCRVLIVDDHVPTLRMMSRLVQSLGHDVRSADHAAAALAMVVADPPELLISDIGMPNQSGWSLLSDIRLRCHVPPVAIAVSGYGTDDDLRRSRDAGFAAHLVKPVDLQRLTAAIRQVMG